MSTVGLRRFSHLYGPLSFYYGWGQYRWLRRVSLTVGVFFFYVDGYVIKSMILLQAAPVLDLCLSLIL